MVDVFSLFVEVILDVVENFVADILIGGEGSGVGRLDRSRCRGLRERGAQIKNAGQDQSEFFQVIGNFGLVLN